MTEKEAFRILADMLLTPEGSFPQSFEHSAPALDVAEALTKATNAVWSVYPLQGKWYIQQD